jgi:predicted TIM-barrel fold metal-dependent hydrolase
MVLDTHAHCWGPPSEEHPWTNSQIIGGSDEYASGDFLQDFTVDLVYTGEKLLADMDRLVVEEAVIVGYPICPWTDNWYTVQVVEEYDRFTGVVMIDQFADDAIDQLEELMSVDGILGFRLGAGCPYDRMWQRFDPTVDWLLDAIDEEAYWEAAEALDAAVHIWTLPPQLDQVVEFVETYPELTYVIDHHSYIRGDVRPGAEPFEQLAKLAAHDNVLVKLSGVVTLSDEEYPYRDKHDHVTWLLEQFGRERVAWGSDWPNESNDATYLETLTWLEHVDELSQTDLEWLTERSFKRHVGMD